MTHKGKIGRLPHPLREELNHRLRDGEPGRELVRWLNGLPEMKQVVDCWHGGKPVTAQNLSEWKQGGHQAWLAKLDVREHMAELAADARDIRESAGAVADHLACAVAVRFAAAFDEWDETPTHAAMRKLRALRPLCETVNELRKGDHHAGRLEIERERLHLARMSVEKLMNEEFERWMERPDIQRRIRDKEDHQARVAARIREIFGVEPLKPASPVDAATYGLDGQGI